ncbi:ribonuclease H-like domain-containing protein [Tanacetum coccineum]
MLKLGEYEMWEIRIKQYFQIQDYALWEVIENGNSWVPIPVTAPESGPSTALKMTVPSTAEEKICKKNDVKARSLLLMALPNEHQLTFNQYVDAQSMFAAIKARFGGNEATKRTQKALLKQQYENFNASSSESLDSIFNRLQKLVSRLAILGVVTPPEDLNVKFLRSLPSEWDTHVVVWMNKPDFDTMGLDDLYNNFKIVEQKVKRSTGAINDEKNLAFLTTTGASSINNINTVNPEVSTGTTKVNTASTETRFLSQLHDDDLEEMDLKWNMALLSMRARKFYQRTGRKIIIDGSSTAGYDKSKVECFNSLKKQYDDLLVKLDDTGFKASTYKRGHKEYLMGLLRTELEKVKEEKEGFKFKIAKFEKSSKDLDQLLASQITDKSKKGFGLSVVLPILCKPNTDCDKESDNSKENIDDSLKQQQKTDSSFVNSPLKSNSQLNDKGFVNSGCSRHMSGNIAHISDLKDFEGDIVTFGGEGAKGGELLAKIPLKLINLDFLPDENQEYSLKFLNRTKDETSEILKNFIKEVENLVDKKVKIIRSDNGTEFKNKVMDEFCREKGIKREYSVARTPQQNGVAERKNRTLIEAARTMLADSKLPTTFWAEAVSTACYVQNRVLIVKPHNKTPYETSISKAFRVYNIRTRKVQENLHIGFLDNKPMIEGNGIQGVSESSTSCQQDQDCNTPKIQDNAAEW